MGSLHNIDFGVFWASWGGSGKEPGSRGRFLGQFLGNRVARPEALFRGSEGCEPEVSKVSVFDGFRGVRFCSRGLDRTGSGNWVPRTRGIKKVPGQGSESYAVLWSYTGVL